MRMWDTASGKELCHFIGHERGTQGFAIAPDGKVLASVGQDGTARLWDLKTGKELLRLATGGEPSYGGVAFSPDGKLLATSDTALKLWDPGTGQLLHQFDTPVWIFCLAFSPDGRTLAAASEEKGDHIISLWDVANRKLIRRIKGQTGRVYSSLAFSPDGTSLASSGSDALCQWKASTGEELRVLMKKGGGYPPACCAFSPDGKTIAGAGGYEGVIRLFAADTGKELRSFGGHRWVAAIAFSPDGKTLATGGDDSAVRLWDVATGKERLASLGGQTAANSLALSPDAATLAVDSGWGDVNCYGAATGKLIRRLEGVGKEGWAEVLGFAPDGKTLFYRESHGESSDSVMSCNVASGEKLQCLDLKKRRGNLARLSPDRKTAVFSEPLRLVDMTTGKELPLSGDWRAFAFSPDGKALATATRKGDIRLWSVATGKELRRIQGSEGASEHLAFSPDGRWLASGVIDRSNRDDDYGVQLWDAATGDEMHTLRGHRGRLGAVVFSLDGRMLATAGDDRPTILLWEVANGKQRAAISGHRGPVSALAFSRDGRRLASGSKDATALLWDLPSLAGPPRPAELSPADLRRRWDDLASDDAALAYRAVWELAGSPKAAVPFLGDRLRPVPAPDAKRLAQLITDLNDDAFAVRDRARATLEELDEAAERALEKEAASPASAESARLAKALLDRLKAGRRTPTGRQLQALRALEVLEHIGTPEAKSLLDRLGQGAPGVRLTREAQASLRRLAGKQ